MTKCESCGATFEFEGLQEIASSRILCPSCAAKRLQQRRRATASGDAANTAAAASTLRTRVPHDDDHAEKLAERRREARQQKRRQTILGAASVGGLLVLLVVWALIASSRAAAEEQARSERAAREEATIKELLAYDQNDPESLRKLVARGKATADIWQTTPRSMEVDSAIRRAEAKINASEQQDRVTAALDAAEKVLPGATTPDQLSALAKQLTEVQGKLAKSPPELQARGAAIRGKVDLAYANALSATAIAAAAAGATAANLGQCRVAEDALETVLADGRALEPAVQRDLRGKLTEVVSASDRLAAALAQPGTEGPWQELTQRADDWQPSQTPGFAVTTVSGELDISGPDADHKGNGMATLSRRDPVRDCELDLECRLDSGSATIYLRLGQKADRKLVPVVDLTTENPGAEALALQAGKPATVHVRLLGSRLEAHGEAGATGSLQRAVPPTARAGRFAIATSPGTHLHLQRFALRTLP